MRDRDMPSAKFYIQNEKNFQIRWWWYVRCNYIFFIFYYFNLFFYTGAAVLNRRLFRRQFHRWIGHVTIWSWCFESLGESVSISIGESATSPYGANVLHPSMIPSVKIPPITSTSANRLFLKKFSTFRS